MDSLKIWLFQAVLSNYEIYSPEKTGVKAFLNDGSFLAAGPAAWTGRHGTVFVAFTYDWEEIVCVIHVLKEQISGVVVLSGRLTLSTMAPGKGTRRKPLPAGCRGVSYRESSSGRGFLS